ncbi:MAG: CcdC family protein [Bacilli bacterium]
MEKYILAIGLFMGVFMTGLMFFVRMKASAYPTSAKKILLPPLFMSSGALMYIIPQFRLSSVEIGEAIILGLIFSIPLIRTSKFEVKNGEIYLQRSKAFVFVLLGLIVVRTAIKFLFADSIDAGEISGMSWLLAFCMIVPWRIAMYRGFLKVKNNMPKLAS